jgi:hypothetical protein
MVISVVLGDKVAMDGGISITFPADKWLRDLNGDTHKLDFSSLDCSSLSSVISLIILEYKKFT